MSPERREFLNACWTAGYDAFEAACLLGDSKLLTLSELLEISQLFESNEILLASIAKNVTPRGMELDRR